MQLAIFHANGDMEDEEYRQKMCKYYFLKVMFINLLIDKPKVYLSMDITLYWS